MGLEEKKGLPVGNLTSQFFANIYLNKLDHFVKQSPPEAGGYLQRFFLTLKAYWKACYIGHNKTNQGDSNET
jgi:hypothetical protein